jgi:hypothetical protein
LKCLQFIESRTVHTDTLCGQSLPHRKHVSATELNKLMLCGESVAVCCADRTEHAYTLWAVRTSQETLLRYRAQPVNAVWGKSRCLVCGPYGTHRYTVWAVLTSQETRLRYRAQQVNAVWGKCRCLLCGPYGTLIYTVGSPYLTGDTSRLRYRAQPVNAVCTEHTDTFASMLTYLIILCLSAACAICGP